MNIIFFCIGKQDFYKRYLCTLITLCCIFSISTKLTNLSEKERIEQHELDVKCLQLLRGLMHNEIVKLPEDFEGDVNSCKK